jgi:hypothetical protein
VEPFDGPSGVFPLGPSSQGVHEFLVHLGEGSLTRYMSVVVRSASYHGVEPHYYVGSVFGFLEDGLQVVVVLLDFLFLRLNQGLVASFQFTVAVFADWVLSYVEAQEVKSGSSSGCFVEGVDQSGLFFVDFQPHILEPFASGFGSSGQGIAVLV